MTLPPLLEPPPEVARHPVTARARLLADDFRSTAGAVDLVGVDRPRLDRLAAAGLHGLAVDGTPVGVAREVAELLAGADGNTWFTWVQHAAALAGLAASPNEQLRDLHLADATAGRTQLGLSWAHVRPRPVPAVTATPAADGGWDFDGIGPWATGYGLLDQVTIGGTSPMGEVVMVMVPFTEQPGLTVGPPQELLALAATRTVALHLRHFHATPLQQVSVQDLNGWAHRVGGKSANATPAVFGLARSVLGALCDTVDGQELAGELTTAVARCRRAVYELADDPGTDDSIHAERLRLRAESLLLLQSCSIALITALGGRAMESTGDPARWAREALFHLVQGQTQEVRRETLAATGIAATALAATAAATTAVTTTAATTGSSSRGGQP